MQLIPFEQTAIVKATTKVANWFAAAVGAGYKVLSIKSKVFTVVDGDQKTIITKKEYDANGQVVDTDAPAPNVEVIILSVNPHKSKVFYNTGYAEGSAEKPTCYSNNGVSPAADAAEPQAKKCAVCPHSVFGSKITENGKRAKACSDSMRLAVAAPDRLDDPMLLRVPATSLPLLGTYGAELAQRGKQPHEVVTKIGFDYTVSHPALTFKPVGVIPAGNLPEVEAARAAPTVDQITGITEAMAPVDEDFVPPPTPKAAPKAEAPAPKAEPAKPTAKAKPAPAVAGDDSDLPTEPKAKVKVEAPVAATADAASDGLDDLDFDD